VEYVVHTDNDYAMDAPRVDWVRRAIELVQHTPHALSAHPNRKRHLHLACRHEEDRSARWLQHLARTTTNGGQSARHSVGGQSAMVSGQHVTPKWAAALDDEAAGCACYALTGGQEALMRTAAGGRVPNDVPRERAFLNAKGHVTTAHTVVSVPALSTAFVTTAHTVASVPALSTACLHSRALFISPPWHVHCVLLSLLQASHRARRHLPRPLRGTLAQRFDRLWPHTLGLATRIAPLLLPSVRRTRRTLRCALPVGRRPPPHRDGD
jgi:hypothetical protein